MTNRPLVSVIIPTYNRVDKISTAIESVYAQTYPNIQLIVSDDGSTDGTEAFIKENYPQIDYILIEHGGQAAARNGGLSISKGTIIASLDSDDKWWPEFLEVCVDKMEAENLDFVFTNWIQQFAYHESTDFLWGAEFLDPFIKDKDEKWQPLSSADLRKLYLKDCPSPSSSAVIRKSSMVAGWNSKIDISDDWCMFLDMILAKECKAAFTMDPHWNKYINEKNIYDGRKRSEVLELLYIKDTFEFMDRFKNKVTKSEFRVLTKRCVRGFVELSKHHLISGFNLGLSLRLMRDSIKLSLWDTLTAMNDVIIFGLNRRVKDRLFELEKGRTAGN
jgi:glycosyltransferase involved in cell wall biosynthesis